VCYEGPHLECVHCCCNEDERNEQAKVKELLKLYSQVSNEDSFPIVTNSDENCIYIDKLEIFPLDVTISIGANNYYWPVMYPIHSSLYCLPFFSFFSFFKCERVFTIIIIGSSEAHISLSSFQRSSLYHNIYSLLQFVTSAYSKFAWCVFLFNCQCPLLS
jgi:hypothetical protein